MLDCMQSTSVRLDVATHRELKALAAQLGVSVGQAVAVSVRGMRQAMIGAQLHAAPDAAEQAWLDADLG